MDANQTAGEETWRQLHKNVESNIEQVLATTPHETTTVRPLASHHDNYTGQTSQTRRTLLEKQGRARKWCTPMDPHIWPSKSRTYSSYVRTQDVTQKTCRRLWTIGKSGERWSRISVLAARHDDDDDIYIYIYIYIYHDDDDDIYIYIYIYIFQPLCVNRIWQKVNSNR